MAVYVISKDGTPLMPTKRFRKVRILLKEHKAKVVSKEPFTIKLLYDSTTFVQELNLGVDTGSKTIGTAVTNLDGDVFYISKVQIRNDIKSKMDQRRIYRRNRRSRKTRYRKPRFLNRRNSIKTGRLPPTVVSKLHSHVKEIEFIKSILPVKNIIIETGSFDPHLMKNPLLRKYKWGYQKGTNYGFENTKSMVRFRDNYTCQYCKGKSKDSKLEVHHIQFRSNGGSDDPSNLITLCSKCHHKLHNNKIKLDLTGQKKSALNHATQMNIIRSQLLKLYPNAIETFGYVTKLNSKLPKDHHFDACVISKGDSDFKRWLSFLYCKRIIPEGDYRRTRGIRSEQKLPKGKVHGFRKFDKVKYLKNVYFIKGTMSTGYAFLMDINGTKIDFSNMPKGFKTPKMKNFKRLSARKSWICTKEEIIPNIA